MNHHDRLQNQHLHIHQTHPVSTATASSDPDPALQLHHAVVLDREEVAQRAYAIHQREGCPHGRALANWLEAEADVMSVTPGLAADAMKYGHRSF